MKTQVASSQVVCPGEVSKVHGVFFLLWKFVPTAIGFNGFVWPPRGKVTTEVMKTGGQTVAIYMLGFAERPGVVRSYRPRGGRVVSCAHFRGGGGGVTMAGGQTVVIYFLCSGSVFVAGHGALGCPGCLV